MNGDLNHDEAVLSSEDKTSNEGTVKESTSEAPKMCRVLSIDAWRDAEGGWQWNNWHSVGEVPIEVIDYEPRRLFKYMREAGFLSRESAGRVSMEDDQYNVVIMSRHTHEPLFAIEYGNHF